MKKIRVSFILVMIFVFFTACDPNKDTYTVQNGTYVLVQTETSLLPYITISDKDISFSYDILSSYLAYGTYSIEDDILTMTTDDRMYNFVFQIDGDNLIFQKNESSLVTLINEQFGVKLTDKAIFKLKDN